MRFILASIALVLAVLLGGFGVAQRTILSGPDTLVAAVQSSSDAPVTVVSGETLKSLDGRQRLEIGGSPAIFAAYGRTTDVMAWIGDARHNTIAFDPETNALTSTETGSEATVPNPAGSDLWLLEYTGENVLDINVNLNTDLSFIIVSDGTAPAPADISIAWPLDNRTPLAGPFMAAGGLMLVIALALLVWAFMHRRRTRGPRRKSIKGPKSQRMPRLPRQRSYRVRRPAALGAARGRRSTTRMTAIIPVVLIGTLALSGCSADLWPEIGADTTSASPTPSPSSSLAADPVEETLPPVATVRQVESIVADVSLVAETADAALDAAALDARFMGPALALRTGNYETRAKDSAYPAPTAIPAGEIDVTLPEQAETWPRVVLAVVSSPPDTSTDPATQAAPIALTLLQQTPREQYKVYYATTITAAPPELAPATVGAPRLDPDTKLLAMAPSQLAAAYVDVLNVGEASASYPLFDIPSDGLIPQSGVAARETRTAALDAKAAIAFSITAGDAQTIALLSNAAGGLVSVYLNETETVTPVETGATINPEGATKTLSGITGTTKGVTATYGDQLLFYIPPIGSQDKIVLLGYTQGLLTAKEIE
ncbi:MAG: hypothetical protein H7146_06405 [Burkholderiaceae bacterium]|nr:hypothetical protein [Microbacteriaceae bacterium]